MRVKLLVKEHLPVFLYPLYLRYKYKRVIGKRLDLNNPKTYTEKMQWAKLYRRSAILTELSDKVAVRTWVKSKIGEKYLIPTGGEVYSNAEDIDFSQLPDRYVIKLNTGSGRNIIVNDSTKLNVEETRRNLKRWMKNNFAYDSFELQYKEIKPRIYIEKKLA